MVKLVKLNKLGGRDEVGMTRTIGIKVPAGQEVLQRRKRLPRHGDRIRRD